MAAKHQRHHGEATATSTAASILATAQNAPSATETATSVTV
jgi:hypothetical protein